MKRKSVTKWILQPSVFALFILMMMPSSAKAWLCDSPDARWLDVRDCGNSFAAQGFNTDFVEMYKSPVGAICQTNDCCTGESCPPADQFSCTGTLIGPDLFLTAGHCFFMDNNSEQPWDNAEIESWFVGFKGSRKNNSGFWLSI